MSEKPRILVVAGPNGAGKSTVAASLLAGTPGIEEYVNADIIARGLSELHPERVAIQAGRFMLRRLANLSEQRKDFAFETTLANRSMAPWLVQRLNDGYVIELAYLWLANADLAVSRVSRRVLSGGHSIPEAVIRRRYVRSLKNFFGLYRKIVSEWSFFDNSREHGSILVASGSEKSTTNIFEPMIWKSALAFGTQNGTD